MSYYRILGLEKEPFSTSPDPAFFYECRSASSSGRCDQFGHHLWNAFPEGKNIQEHSRTHGRVGRYDSVGVVHGLPSYRTCI